MGQKGAFSDDAWRCWVSHYHTLHCRKCSVEAGKCSRCTVLRRKNSQSPIVVWHEDGVTRADVYADRSLFLEFMSTTWCSSLARYGGVVPCRRWKMSTESLNSICSGARSQRRSRSSGVMWLYYRAEQTSHAAAFITDCTLCSWLPGRPVNVALP